MNIIIVGCGRVGSQLAVMLSKAGNNVSVIDKDQSSFRSLGRDFNGHTVRGLGFDEDILEAAGIDSADVVVAATNLDNTNLMTAEVARRLYEVPHVITRLSNPDRSSAYIQLGLDYVCGTKLVSEELYSKILAGHNNHMESFGEFELLSFSFNSPTGTAVRVGDIERPRQIRIVVFEHEELSMTPTPDSILHDGDKVIAAVHQDLREDFLKYIKS